MVTINKDVTTTSSGVVIEPYLLNILDIFAKWDYEAINNYDGLPIPVSGVYVSGCRWTDNGVFRFDIRLNINMLYEEATEQWVKLEKSPYRGEYWDEYYNDFLPVYRQSGLLYNNMITAYGVYNIPLPHCKTIAQLDTFLREFYVLLRQRYPDNRMKVDVEVDVSTLSNGDSRSKNNNVKQEKEFPLSGRKVHRYDVIHLYDDSCVIVYSICLSDNKYYLFCEDVEKKNGRYIHSYRFSIQEVVGEDSLRERKDMHSLLDIVTCLLDGIRKGLRPFIFPLYHPEYVTREDITVAKKTLEVKLRELKTGV